MARRPYLGENSRYDPAALTRARVAELLSELRAHCAALKGGAAQADTPYAVWETLERLGRWGEAAAALKSALVAEGYGPSAERPRLALSEVALVVIDCSTPGLAAEAMRLSLAQCAFGDAILFTDTAVTVTGVRVVPIPRIASESEY